MTNAVKKFIQRNQTKRQQVGYHDPIGTVVVNVKPEPASPASVAKHGKQPPAKVLAEAFPGVVAMNAALQKLKPVESNAPDTPSPKKASREPEPGPSHSSHGSETGAPEAAHVPPGVAAMNAALERQKKEST